MSVLQNAVFSQAAILISFAIIGYLLIGFFACVLHVRLSPKGVVGKFYRKAPGLFFIYPVHVLLSFVLSILKGVGSRFGRSFIAIFEAISGQKTYTRKYHEYGYGREIKASNTTGSIK